MYIYVDTVFCRAWGLGLKVWSLPRRYAYFLLGFGMALGVFSCRRILGRVAV